MRLLLTHGFFLEEDAKEREIMRPYPPLGILYISSYLRSRGFDVDVYDSTFGSRSELYSLLQTTPPALLGIYTNLLTRRSVLAIIATAKQHGWSVVLGGPEPANYAEEYLAAGADFIVQGEGELALEQLLSGSVPNGVVYRDPNGSIVRTAPATLINDLNSLPWPDRECIDLFAYLNAWRTTHGKSSVSVITARGCPYRCRWCSHSTFGLTHRRRSVENVADEVESIVERYNPDMLWYADDVFTIHPGWLMQYAAELKRRGIRLPFECITRADRMNAKIADTLAELGCYRIWIGSESGSQRILDRMERGVTIAQVQQAVALVQSRGIQAGMFLMWGYEGEEPADIEATVDHVKTCRPDVFLTTVSYPIAGTPYHSEVANKLVHLAKWNESTDRDIAIRGRHSRRYYKFADELLRTAVDPQPDAARIAAARTGLHQSFSEVEA